MNENDFSKDFTDNNVVMDGTNSLPIESFSHLKSTADSSRTGQQQDQQNPLASDLFDYDKVIKIVRAKNEWESSIDCLKQIGIILLDKNLQVIRASKAVETWGLVPVNFARGLHISEIINPILGEYSRREFHKVWRAVNNQVITEWISKHNALGKTLRFTFNPASCDKTIPGMKKCTTLLVIEDITERKNFLNYLQDSVVKLQHADNVNKQKLSEVNKKLEIKSLKEFQHKKKIHKYEKELLTISRKLIDAQDSERKRIAGELHDGLGQILTAVKYQIEGVLFSQNNHYQESILGNDLNIEEILSNIKTAMLEVRRVSMNLRPSMLDEIGLLASMECFFREFNKVYASFQIDRLIDIAEDSIPTNIKFVIFRVLQESMNNIAKHSKADSISIVLRELENVIILRIVDDGRGFDIHKLPENKNLFSGVNNMRERAESSGAKFTVYSQENKGTVIQLQWRKNRL